MILHGLRAGSPVVTDIGCCPFAARNTVLQERQSPPGGLPGGLVGVLLLALQQPHVGSLGALRPLRDVELDGLPLGKRAVARRLDRAEMHEDVDAGFGGDEAVALLVVEPLHGSNSHVLVPPSIVLEVSISAGTVWAGGKGQARPAGCEAKREPLPGHGSGCGDGPPPSR